MPLSGHIIRPARVKIRASGSHGHQIPGESCECTDKTKKLPWYSSTCSYVEKLRRSRTTLKLVLIFSVEQGALPPKHKHLPPNDFSGHTSFSPQICSATRFSSPTPNQANSKHPTKKSKRRQKTSNNQNNERRRPSRNSQIGTAFQSLFLS